MRGPLKEEGARGVLQAARALLRHLLLQLPSTLTLTAGPQHFFHALAPLHQVSLNNQSNFNYNAVRY